MAKLNKSCRVCNTAYSYCPSCNYREPTYKQLVCSENCWNIWDALSHNGVGLWNTQDTLEALDKIQMPSTLQPRIQEHIDRLLAEVEVEIETIMEEPIVEEVIPVVVIEDEPVVIEPVKAPKKKNKPVKAESIEVVFSDEV